MQVWEHLCVMVWEADWADSLGRSGRLDRVKSRFSSGDWHDLAPLLNELGREGWELAGTLSGGGTHNYKLILKRPNTGQAARPTG